jgi:hypothetical protein
MTDANREKLRRNLVALDNTDPWISDSMVLEDNEISLVYNLDEDQFKITRLKCDCHLVNFKLMTIIMGINNIKNEEK